MKSQQHERENCRTHCTRLFVYVISLLLMSVGCVNKEITVSTIGLPAKTDGMILTVTHIDDRGDVLNVPKNEERPITINVRITNLGRGDIKVHSDAFAIIDSAGVRKPVSGLIFDQTPPNERELKKGETVLAGVHYTTGKNLTDLALAFESKGDRLQIQLFKDENAAKLSFTSLDLQTELVKAGDLPNGVAGGEIAVDNISPEIWELSRIEEPTIFMSQRIQDEDGQILGTVFVYGYKSLDSVDAVFSNIAGKSSQQVTQIDGLGEGAVFSEASSITFEQLSFTRCHAIVSISVTNEEAENILSFDARKAYAVNLDERLTEIVCD